MESACSPHVCVGLFQVLRFSPTVQKHAVRLIVLGVIVSVCERPGPGEL